MKPDTIEEAVILKRFLNIPEGSGTAEKTVGNCASITAARFEDLERNMDVMNMTRENFAYRNLYSCRKYIGSLIVFCKRVVRKCLKWYLEPVCFQQTDFNNATTLAIDRLRELQQDTTTRLDELQQETTTRLDDLQRETTTRLDDLQRETTTRLDDSQRETTTRLDDLQQETTTRLDGLQQETITRLNEFQQDILHYMDDKESKIMLIAAQNREQTELLNKAVFCPEREEERQRLQRHDEQIGILTVEHNGRLDILEGRVTELEALLKFSSQALSAAQTQLEQLHDQGAFDYIVQDKTTLRRSASQSGEDGILSHVLQMLGIPESNCTYLDLGANHAKHLSNTYYFYQMGARGVLVEANPSLLAELKLYRSRDVVLNRCISVTSGQLVPFYILSGDGLSTPDKAEAEAAIATNPELRITHTAMVETISVNEIMEAYFDGAPVFLNIDIEGYEMEILRTLDLEAHRPLAVSVEVIPYRTHLVIGEKNQEIVEFMAQNDYIEYAFTGINSIFLDKRQLGEARV